MFELTYRNKKVTELTDIQSQKVHTGGTKFAKKNKHTCTTIRDTRVLAILFQLNFVEFLKGEFIIIFAKILKFRFPSRKNTHSCIALCGQD